MFLKGALAVSPMASRIAGSGLSDAVACDLELCRRDLAVIQPSHPFAGKGHICTKYTDMHRCNTSTCIPLVPLNGLL